MCGGIFLQLHFEFEAVIYICHYVIVTPKSFHVHDLRCSLTIQFQALRPASVAAIDSTKRCELTNGLSAIERILEETQQFREVA